MCWELRDENLIINELRPYGRAGVERPIEIVSSSYRQLQQDFKIYRADPGECSVTHIQKYDCRYITAVLLSIHDS